VEIRPIRPTEIEAARPLPAANGRAERVADAKRFQQLVANSQRALVAVDDGKVVGFARAGEDDRITWVLRAGRAGVPPFYEKLGFVRSTAAMERRRSSKTKT
jgi:hypothetical protein